MAQGAKPGQGQAGLCAVTAPWRCAGDPGRDPEARKGSTLSGREGSSPDVLIAKAASPEGSTERLLARQKGHQAEIVRPLHSNDE